MRVVKNSNKVNHVTLSTILICFALELEKI